MFELMSPPASSVSAGRSWNPRSFFCFSFAFACARASLGGASSVGRCASLARSLLSASWTTSGPSAPVVSVVGACRAM